ncbi:MAG: YbjN domain-containing protein [Clostridia bacterium]|nr:YbjN domain-containing protein [Clostridia bacterium]
MKRGEKIMFGKGNSGTPKAAESVSDAITTLTAFTEQLDKEGIHYRVNEERPIVSVPYSGKNFEGLNFMFVFDSDGNSYSLKVYSIEQFTADQLPDAYEFCNAMNAEFRWIKFYVDSDNEFTAQDDGVVDVATAGAECSEILHRAVSIVDEVCKRLHE